MYWLFDSEKQFSLREEIERLVLALSEAGIRPTQQDQLFPFVGRKDRRKAVEVVKNLTEEGQVVCDPFTGSGILAYAIAQENRHLLANEYEIYTNRMASAPWRLPNEEELQAAYEAFCSSVQQDMDELYKTTCICGHAHVLHSLFFDREPLSHQNVTQHERLGEDGKNIIYRRQYKCPNCGATEKHFDTADMEHMLDLERRPVSEKFDATLIENSRINLSRNFTVYRNLFPHRSMLALDIMWAAIDGLDFSLPVKMFLQDVFLSILPQAKYKDYRSKSQDLHCPQRQLREVNLLYAFQDQYKKRLEGLKSYTFVRPFSESDPPITCMDFRDFLAPMGDESVDLMFTDPPWADGNAYFERAQLYHPWLEYSLDSDDVRLEREVVITDAPSRRNVHNVERWWQDMQEMFMHCGRVLKSERYFALMFRPIRASEWLSVLNRIKFIARAEGFEPLLTVDLKNADPSMRIQQSASYAFVEDIVMLFIKLPSELRRLIVQGTDIDQLVFQTAEELQENISSAFSYRQWRERISLRFVEEDLHDLNLPASEEKLLNLFNRYCDEVEPGKFLTKHLTPFSGQLFDLPAVERFFTYVPKVVSELSETRGRFTYSEFLLKLAQFVENGTRRLIQEITDIGMQDLLDTYAERIPDTKYFIAKTLPNLPVDIKKVMDLDPYEFEAFVGHLLNAQGFSEIVLAGRSGDRGVDIIATDPEGLRVIVQCKQWAGNKVGSTPVQRLDSFARTRHASRKILVTTSNFTPQGIDEARITGTETINGEQLQELIARYMPDFVNGTD